MILPMPSVSPVGNFTITALCNFFGADRTIRVVCPGRYFMAPGFSRVGFIRFGYDSNQCSDAGANQCGVSAVPGHLADGCTHRCANACRLLHVGTSGHRQNQTNCQTCCFCHGPFLSLNGGIGFILENGGCNGINHLIGAFGHF